MTKLQTPSKLAHDLHPELSGQTGNALADDGTLVNMQADPMEAWLAELEAGTIDVVSTHGGRGSKEQPICGMTPDEFAATVLASAFANPQRIYRRVMVDGKDFHTGIGAKGPNLNSVRKRIERVLTNEKREERQLTMSHLQMTEIPKGTKINANGDKTPANVLRLVYTLTQDQYEALAAIRDAATPQA